MTTKNIVLVGNHGSGKKIFLTRLCNKFDFVSYTNIKLSVNTETTTKVTHKIKNDDSSDFNEFTIESKSECKYYKFNIDVILLDDVPTYNFGNVDAVLFFSNGNLESQIAIAYMDRKYVQHVAGRRAVFYPATKKLNRDIIFEFEMIVEWPCSTRDNSTVQYADVMINLFDIYNSYGGNYKF